MAKSMKPKAKRSWQDIAREVQDYRDSTIDQVQPAIPKLPADLPRNVLDIPTKLLGQVEIQITEASPEELLAALATGTLTATSVTRAFLRRAALAQKLVSLQSLDFYLFISPTISRPTASQNSSLSEL